MGKDRGTRSNLGRDRFRGALEHGNDAMGEPLPKGIAYSQGGRKETGGGVRSAGSEPSNAMNLLSAPGHVKEGRKTG